FKHHLPRRLVFDARPYFIRVEHYVVGAAALRPGADDQSLILCPGKGARRVFPPGEIRLKVIFENTAQGGDHFVFWKNIAEAELMRPPLADELVSHAAGSNLSGTIRVVWQVLLEVFAVLAQFDQFLLAFLKDAVKSRGGGFISHSARPFLTCAQGSEIVSANEGSHPVQGFVIGVPLVILQDAAGLSTGALGIA